MEVGEREAQAIATLTNFATPANIATILAKVETMDGLRLHQEQASPMAAVSIAYKCGIAARAMEICAGYGNGAAKQVATELGISERAVNRLTQWWRTIFKPAIDARGPAVTFNLEEGIWYSTANEAAPIVEKTPLELIDEAAARKAENPKFRPSEWRRELGVTDNEGSTGAPDKAIVRWLKRAAKFETGDGVEFAKNADREMLNVARDAIAFAREILDELESRFAGRVEP